MVVLLLSLQTVPVLASDDPADGRDIFTDAAADGTSQLSTTSTASAGSSGSTGSSATLTDQSGTNSSAFSNATYELEVELAGDPPGSQLSITVHEQYLIQNKTTAQRAANDTIAHEWHDGASRLEHAFDLQDESATGLEYRGDPVVTFTSANTTTGSNGGYEVRVRHDAVLTNVSTRHEPPVAALHDAFGTDASVTVEAPGQAAHHNADDAFVDRSGQTLRWTGDADTERAELVFDDDAFETDTRAVGLLGTLLVMAPFVVFAVGAGLVLALIALLLVISLRLLSVLVRMALRLLVALGHKLFR
ncbi:hypothetical protein C483_03125 [Natrialba hulunbeirensis JCM 10989]|uniref:Uncharacterized protein n=1 Tax=Natrialba hulunbeirensis JCM 10989 TaxID=1227493 RepID=M0AAP8_9EURY|nr:hypothetical protein C483_03125 [Natrialba hulunbeirensis JCM 10989]